MGKGRIWIVLGLAWVLAACASGPEGSAFKAYRGGDYRTALAELHPLADQGDDQAQLHLGFLYRDGLGVNQDLAEARKWFRRSAEQGNGQAQIALGRLYMDHMGPFNDDVQALLWFNFAAAQGSAEGAVLREKVSVRMTPVQIAEAQRLGRDFRPEAEYRKMLADLLPQAEKGSAAAQAKVASLYYHGRGVPRDYAEAVRWYGKAAQQGDALAQANLGHLYGTGQGVQQDYRAAAQWYYRAAEQDNAVAQYRLGSLYEKGLGVPQSEVYALMWYILSAARGQSQAVIDRDRLTGSLASSQVNEAQRLAREFRVSGK